MIFTGARYGQKLGIVRKCLVLFNASNVLDNWLYFAKYGTVQFNIQHDTLAVILATILRVR